jgi:MFS transporter, ACDE family, multidrug resistance protein
MVETSNRQKRARMITVFATFLAFMGIGVVDPILPIIAEQIGASHWQVEMLFTAYILTMAFMMIPSGILANRLGDKRMMSIGLSIVTLFALFCGLSNNIPELSIFRAGWGLGNSMFFATTMTLLIALSSDAHQAIGMYEAAIGLGMAGGPLVGGILGGYSWRFPFVGTSILIFVALMLVIFFVYEPKTKVKRKVAGGRELFRLLAYKPFLRVALSAMFYYYGFFVILAYSPLILKLSAIQLGLVFFGWGLFLAYGSAILSHRLEKSYTPKQIIPYSLLGVIVCLGLLYVVKSTVIIVALIIISGVALGLSNALFTSYSMGVSPYERSITSGAYNFVRWLGAAVAPVLSGIVGESVSLRFPFLLAGMIVLCGFILTITAKEPEMAEVENRSA